MSGGARLNAVWLRGHLGRVTYMVAGTRHRCRAAGLSEVADDLLVAYNSLARALRRVEEMPGDWIAARQLGRKTLLPEGCYVSILQQYRNQYPFNDEEASNLKVESVKKTNGTNPRQFIEASLPNGMRVILKRGHVGRTYAELEASDSDRPRRRRHHRTGGEQGTPGG